MFENKKIGMIGCGKMGAILLQGILRRSLVSAGQILVADAVRERIEEIRKAHPEMVAEENGNLARQADILIVPNIEAGNIFGKLLTYYCHYRVAHVVMGTRAPILIPSRADDGETKMLCMAMALASMTR